MYCTIGSLSFFCASKSAYFFHFFFSPALFYISYTAKALEKKETQEANRKKKGTNPLSFHKYVK